MDIKSIKVGICGLGLIGGSLAKALRRKCGVSSICALDKNNNSLNEAIADKVIDVGSTYNYDVFNDCDIVFICTPIDYIVPVAVEISKVSGAIITDTASTKANIISKIPANIRFVGAHPMAGSHSNGYSASTETLFENAIYVVCSGEKEDKDLLLDLIKEIGAISMQLEPVEHDRAVGVISHLPHIVAASLVNTTSNSDKEDLLFRLAAGGFKDLTRIASSDAELWEQILLSSGNIVEILNNYKVNLDRFIDALISKDKASLVRLLESAKAYRERINNNKKGLLPAECELYIEVTDKPGIIGSVATLLGDNNINIKNLYIENNRDYEGGSMRVTLEKSTDCELAVDILNSNGFTCRAR